MVNLEDSSGKRELNATNEEEVLLHLYSLLREDLGSIIDFEILDGGTGYSPGDQIEIAGSGYGFVGNVAHTDLAGLITGVNVAHGGYSYSLGDVISINSIGGGSGAVIQPVFAPGTIVVEANTTLDNGVELNKSIRLGPSKLRDLSSKAYWMNFYLDTFYHESNESWWMDNLDSDALTNREEWAQFSNPLVDDTDGDGLNDDDEITFGTKPTSKDTDEDGLGDLNESIEATFGYLRDSDHDGINDGVDLNPITPDGGIGALSFVLHEDKTAYDGTFHLQFSATPFDPDPATLTASTADLNGTVFPEFFYRSNLALGQTYYVRAFIDYLQELTTTALWVNMT